MYSTCLHCHRSLGRNDAIEHFPVGRRIAFDAAKGRLWAVCPHCDRWNLTPIEERWEALEECERLFRGMKIRAQTDNVGLVKLGGGTTRAVRGAVDLIATAGDAAHVIDVVAREAARRAGDFEERAARFARGPRAGTLTEMIRQSASRPIDSVGDLANLPPTNPGALPRLPRVYRLALEMSLHETGEQYALDEELSILERDWREAEEIATIADGELTPLPEHPKSHR